MRINTNVNSMNALRNMSINNKKLAASSEKLSSGYRINRAGDDAAGLAISEKMRSQIRGLDQAARNAEDATSLIQTAEGALNETHSILQRMNELAVQAANDTNVTIDRDAIQAEMDELSKELTRISKDTEFNEQALLNGDFKNKVFHIGANGGQNIELSINDMSAEKLNVCGVDATVTASLGNIKLNNNTNVQCTVTIEASAGKSNAVEKTTAICTRDESTGNITVNVQLAQDDDENSLATNSDVVKAINDALSKEGVNAYATCGSDDLGNGFDSFNTSANATAATYNAEKGIDVSTQAAANSAIETIQKALQTVSTERSKLGAYQNRLDHTINNLGTSSENLSAAESRIRDVDMAKEMSEYTKNSVLAQAAQSMVAQANSQPQSVLSLLQ